ncbi:MAG: CDP-glycerol glycerophosphotransferase family protein [Kineosporiaceae bacterium]
MIPDAPFDVSIVTAVYDVARYLPEFLASIEAQRGVDLSRVEIVAVDDGSTDESLDVLRRWQESSRLTLTVLTKPNGGQATARNVGLERARGTWVTFTDPDDTLDPDYLGCVLRFVREHPDVELVGTNLVLHDDASGRLADTHPLRRRFADGDRLVDLDRTPDLFYASAPAAFFRRSRIEAIGLRFDPAIRPNFEDGHFCTVYLLDCQAPLVGFVASARYHYRKRSDGSSTLQNSLVRPERYTVVPRAGYLDVLERAAARHGRAPEWLQTLVVYELSWFFGAEHAAGGSTAAVGPVADEFTVLLRRIRGHLDRHVVEGFAVRWMDNVWRQILLDGLGDEPWHSPNAVVAAVDEAQELVKVVHRFVGEEPPVEYFAAGLPVTPVHTKVRDHVYFDRVLLRERIAWLPRERALRVRVAGRFLEIAAAWPGATPSQVDPVPRSTGTPVGETMLDVALSQPRRALDAVRRRVVRRLAATSRVRRAYADAWVLMDRLHDADDSAEHLFVYLRDNRPDINAWFTVEAGTPDYERLRAGRHGDRVVAHGSHRWELLMLSCVHLISSHIDLPVHRPPRILKILRPARPTWRFTFLQHGVIKDDLSRWLNPKQIDLFVTSTAGEHASIAGNATPYAFSSKEVRLTGLPRFDRLRRAAEAVPPQERTLLLVAPTWRHWLLPPAARQSQRRTVRDDFLETDFARQWLAVLGSTELADLAQERGLRIGFLPHPNLQSVLPMLDLPAHVEPLAFDGGGIQRLFATAAVLLTDYSSMAFNAAYVDRPVVYFQFDADRVTAGAHVGRAGYFDYGRDGFGPVTDTPERTVEAVREIVARGCLPAPEYARRIERTFVLRDGRCCERVVEAVEQLTRSAPRPAPVRTGSRTVPASRVDLDSVSPSRV